MGFMAALPWIIQGGAAIGGMFAGKKAQSAAMKRSPEEEAALGGASNAASGLLNQGQSLINQGQSYTAPAASYYQTLLRGSRGAMQQAVAGPTAQMTDVYRGAERNLDRAGVQGAGRDVAQADLGRQKASQIAGLTTGVQPMAAQALAGLGGATSALGVGASGNAAGIYGGLLDSAFRNRVYGRQEGEKAGSSIGSLLFDLLSGTVGKMGKGGGGGGSTGSGYPATPPYAPYGPGY